MVRSGFFSFGLFVLLWGAAFLSIDRIVLKAEHKESEDKEGPNLRSLLTTVNDENKHELRVPDWGAFSLMSIGSVTILYSVALPKRQQ